MEYGVIGTLPHLSFITDSRCLVCHYNLTDKLQIQSEPDTKQVKLCSQEDIVHDPYQQQQNHTLKYRKMIRVNGRSLLVNERMNVNEPCYA